jgi:hypothetical protein
MTDHSTTNSDRDLINLIDEAGIAHSFAAALAFAVGSGSIPDEIREPCRLWHGTRLIGIAT